MPTIKAIRKEAPAFGSGNKDVSDAVKNALTAARCYPTAREVPTAELHQNAVRATLMALRNAAMRNDHVAVANFSAALGVLEGGS